MTTFAEKAKRIIADNIYMTIATASLEGKPWISPLFFSYDQHYNLYWISDKNSLHSSFIRSNPRVAIVIFDSRALEGEGDGVYIEAIASELEDIAEIQAVIHKHGQRQTKEQFRPQRVDEVTKSGAWRIYKAVPKAISVLGEGEYINGQYVNRRVEIDLLADGD